MTTNESVVEGASRLPKAWSCFKDLCAIELRTIRPKGEQIAEIRASVGSELTSNLNISYPTRFQGAKVACTRA